MERKMVDRLNNISKLSMCKRLHVAAILVDDNGNEAFGYNHNIDSNGNVIVCDSDEPGNCGCIHAEIHAMMTFNSTQCCELSLYVTHQPCLNCAKAIVDYKHRITKVYYLNDYRNTDGLDFLNNSKIEVIKLEGC